MVAAGHGGGLEPPSRTRRRSLGVHGSAPTADRSTTRSNPPALAPGTPEHHAGSNSATAHRSSPGCPPNDERRWECLPHLADEPHAGRRQAGGHAAGAARHPGRAGEALVGGPGVAPSPNYDVDYRVDVCSPPTPQPRTRPIDFLYDLVVVGTGTEDGSDLIIRATPNREQIERLLPTSDARWVELTSGGGADSGFNCLRQETMFEGVQ